MTQQVAAAKIGIGTIALIRSLQTGEEQKIKLVKSQTMQHEQNGLRRQQQRLDDEEQRNGYIVISDASPLGRALLGKERGDIVTVEAPTGIFAWEIVEIFDEPRSMP